MSNYYCLIAGLPDLTPDDAKVPIPLIELREYLSESLSAKDLELINFYFLKYDNQNLQTYLKNAEAVLHPLGLLNDNELADIIRINRESDKPSYPHMPTYFVPFLQAHFDEKEAFPGLSKEDQLATLYYSYACKSTNEFVRDFFTFMLNVKNIIIGCQSRKFGFELAQTIVGDNDIATIIRGSTTKDLGLAGELEYLDEVLRLAEENNLLERELKLDKLIWNYLEEQTFFHYFSVERVFAYLIKTDILDRWENVRKENGEAIFRRAVGTIKGAYKFSDEFNV